MKKIIYMRTKNVQKCHQEICDHVVKFLKENGASDNYNCYIIGNVEISTESNLIYQGGGTGSIDFSTRTTENLTKKQHQKKCNELLSGVAKILTKYKIPKATFVIHENSQRSTDFILELSFGEQGFSLDRYERQFE